VVPDTSLTEAQFRSYYLRDDIAQWRFAIALFAIPNIAFVAVDFQVYGASPTLMAMFAARVFLLVYSAVAWTRLRTVPNAVIADRWMFGWAAAGAAVMLAHTIARPLEYFGHYQFEVFALLAFFATVPLPPKKKLIAAILYLLAALPLLVFYKVPTSNLYVSNTAFVLVLTVASGFLIAQRIRRYRFLALEARLRLEREAQTDSLTGISNRRAFMDWARGEMARYERNEVPVTVLMLDIDHFKSVNDRFGHDVGDALLAQFSRRIEGELRAYDQFARLGGEEFVVVLPHCNLADAEVTATRLRKAICDTPFSANDSPIVMTVSIGVTRLNTGEKQIDDALKRADAALYAAKDKGRNRVEISP